MSRVGNGFRAVRDQAISLLTIDRGEPHQTVLLAGAGRSGTTWIQGLLNCQNDYRVMFEPFQPLHVDLVRSWHTRQYLSRSDHHHQFLESASQIIAGQIYHPWIDKFNRKAFAQKRLIKEIRAQLFLGWLHQNFPEIPIVLVLRHPCAVANSRLKLGWNPLLTDFLSQDWLMQDFLEPFRSALESTQDPFEQHILGWCIENYVPLSQLNANEVYIAFYENICLNPQSEMSRIFEFIGGACSENLLERSSRPSAVSRNDSAVRSGGSLIHAWKRDITNAQLEKALEICDLFGLQAIYGEESLPLISGEEALNLFVEPNHHSQLA